MMGNNICLTGVSWKIISKFSLLPLIIWISRKEVFSPVRALSQNLGKPENDESYAQNIHAISCELKTVRLGKILSEI